MRDVTNSNPDNQQNHNPFHEAFEVLKRFLQKPMEEIAHLPDWSWKKLILFQWVAATASGILAGLIPPNIYYILFAIFFMPIVSTVSLTLLSLFFFYFFQIFENKVVSFKKLFTMVIFANIPFFMFQCLNQLFAPIMLLGFATSGFLLVVGLSENFGLDKKKALRLIAGLFIVVLLMWLWNKLHIRD